MRILSGIAAGLMALSTATAANAAGTIVDLSSASPKANLSLYTGGDTYPAAGSTVTIGSIDFTLMSYYPASFMDPSVGVVQADVANPSITVDIADILLGGNTTFYSLINSGFGVAGQDIGNLSFNLLSGATIQYELIEGNNVRDHFNGFFNNVAPNVYGTANFGTAPDRLDAQQIVIPGLFAGDTVTSITVNSTNPGGGLPFLAALSFVDIPSAVPEPATWAMMIGGFALAGGALRRRGAGKPALA